MPSVAVLHVGSSSMLRPQLPKNLLQPGELPTPSIGTTTALSAELLPDCVLCAQIAMQEPLPTWSPLQETPPLILCSRQSTSAAPYHANIKICKLRQPSPEQPDMLASR